MNVKIQEGFSKLKFLWNKQTKGQKIFRISAVLFLILIAAIITYFSTKTTLAPLYSNLDAVEAGQIKTNLDGKGITSTLTNNGTTIEVPEKQVDELKVELASEGLPKSGNIDYSFFSDNSKFGMTDNEFNVVKLNAMQTELSNLMKQIDGVQDAKVMLNIPTQGVFVSEQQKNASASIVLTIQPGNELTQKQINALYQLAAKSVPNLATDNIAIMDQNFNYLDLSNSSSDGSTFAEQQDIRHQVEKDIQRQVQSLLGTLMGYNKVVATVSTDIDFTQETDDEKLVEPVDESKMQGIETSAQKITETYSGTDAASGGPTNSGSTSDTTGSTTYQSSSGNSAGDYEKQQSTINYDVNRIHKNIVESPYKIRDLGIQVLVEPPNAKSNASLPASTISDIKNMLNSIVTTSIDKKAGTDVSAQALNNKVVVSVQNFNQQSTSTSATASKASIPWWVYAVGGALLLVIGGLVAWVMAARRKASNMMEDVIVEEEIQQPIDIAALNQQVETEETKKRRQLEKLAKENPDEFTKLLRTWISEE